jgi:hypothetical protein
VGKKISHERLWESSWMIFIFFVVRIDMRNYWGIFHYLIEVEILSTMAGPLIGSVRSRVLLPVYELFEFVTFSSRGFATLLHRSRASPVWYSGAHSRARLGQLMPRALLPCIRYGKSPICPCCNHRPVKT